MQNDLQKIVADRLERLKADIQAEMDNKGVNASGKTRGSFRVEQYDSGVRLVGGWDNTAPIPTLEVGRGGGAVPQGFYYIIKEWSRQKGIQFDTERERGTFAYFLARKIAREGTLRNKTNVDVYSTLTKQASDELKNTIAGVLLTRVKTTLLHGFSV